MNKSGNKFINILPEDWVIRFATTEDSYNMANIHIKSLKQAYQSTISDEALDKLSLEERLNIWHTRILENKLDIFVLYEANKLLSFIDVDTMSHTNKIGEMHRLYSDPDKMRKRPGYFLFKHVLQHYRSAGYEYLFGWVLDKNILARRFYEKLGVVLDSNITKKMTISGCECLALKYIYKF
jgi:GNAT superfamily N-acetyltransferase